MNMREAFEAWANHAAGANPYTPGAFDAFQAGAAFAARKCAEIALKYDYPHGTHDAIREAFPEAFRD